MTALVQPVSLVDFIKESTVARVGKSYAAQFMAQHPDVREQVHDAFRHEVSITLVHRWLVSQYGYERPLFSLSYYKRTDYHD